MPRFGHVEDRPAVRILELGFRAGNNVCFAAHAGFALETHRGDGHYDSFTGNSLSGLGIAHFFSPDEIDELFGSRLTITSLTHTLVTDGLDNGQPIRARWEARCVKEG